MDWIHRLYNTRAQESISFDWIWEMVDLNSPISLKHAVSDLTIYSTKNKEGISSVLLPKSQLLVRILFFAINLLYSDCSHIKRKDKAVRMKTLRVFLAFFTTLLLFVSSPAPALGEVEAHTVYLPMISVPCPKPTLFSPVDAAQLDTLIPTFNFEVPNLPGVTGAGLEISANLNFMPVEYSIGYFGGGGEFTWKLNYNLQPATTYYWRAETKCGSSSHAHSEVRTFASGSGGEILPAPVLLSPPDVSTTDSNIVTFEWSPVVGAESYQLSYQEEGSWWYLVELTDTQSTHTLKPGKNYIWDVEAVNAYAVGESSETWEFTTP